MGVGRRIERRWACRIWHSSESTSKKQSEPYLYVRVLWACSHRHRRGRYRFAAVLNSVNVRVGEVAQTAQKC